MFDELKGDKTITLQIFGKNVQSLKAETREDELIEELKCFDWDFVLLSETWRPSLSERWHTEEGHMFCGSGGSDGKNGVAIMIHRRWRSKFKAFHAISDCLCAVDVDIPDEKIRFIHLFSTWRMF